MTAVLFAAIVPLVIWPIETVFPYPYIIEELTKATLVFFALKAQKGEQLALAVGIGVAFAISETVLYLFNLLAVGSLTTLLTRLALTLPLHVATTVLILLGAQKKYWLVPALALAIAMHYFFNSLAVVWPKT